MGRRRYDRHLIPAKGTDVRRIPTPAATARQGTRRVEARARGPWHYFERSDARQRGSCAKSHAGLQERHRADELLGRVLFAHDHSRGWRTQTATGVIRGDLYAYKLHIGKAMLSLIVIRPADWPSTPLMVWRIERQEIGSAQSARTITGTQRSKDGPAPSRQRAGAKAMRGQLQDCRAVTASARSVDASSKHQLTRRWVPSTAASISPQLQVQSPAECVALCRSRCRPSGRALVVCSHARHHDAHRLGVRRRVEFKWTSAAIAHGGGPRRPRCMRWPFLVRRLVVRGREAADTREPSSAAVVETQSNGALRTGKTGELDRPEASTTQQMPAPANLQNLHPGSNPAGIEVPRTSTLDTIAWASARSPRVSRLAAVRRCQPRIETRPHHSLGIRVRAVEGGTCHTGHAELLSRSISAETERRGKDAGETNRLLTAVS
jgi:hypothetical protein